MIRPKQLIATVAAVASFVAASACSTSSSTGEPSPTGSSSAEDVGFNPVNPGDLTVATNLPNPGFWDGNSPDAITGGYEYAMAEDIAEQLGLSGVKVVNVSFDALVSGQAKDFDVALSTVTITPGRQEVVDFSDPYFGSDQGILVKSGTTVTADNAAGLRWGVQSASSSQEFVANKIKPATPASVYQDQPSMFAALAADQVDAVLLDTVTVLLVAEQSGGTLEVVGQYKTGDAYGAVFPKGSPQTPIISKIIDKLKADGTLDQLGAKYLEPAFGKDPATVPYLNP